MRMAATLVLLLSLGCYRELSSDERLERDSPTPLKPAATENELKSISCADTGAELAKARAENKPEPDRILAYMELYESLKKRASTFDESMRRNPDLSYKEGSQALVDARDLCVQQLSDVRLEFERFTRDIIDVPTVQEIKGGNMVVVARLDFNVLRQAIESLDPDDKDALLNRIATAEKRIEGATEKKGKRK